MTWLILEDNSGRTEAFYEAANHGERQHTLRVWRIASQMINELPSYLDQATLISLDHDLYKQYDNDPEPGCGRDVANYLAEQAPSCPIVIHSTNTDAAWGMYNELTSTGWKVEIIHHLDEPRWIQIRWLELAQKLINAEA